MVWAAFSYVKGRDALEIGTTGSQRERDDRKRSARVPPATRSGRLPWPDGWESRVRTAAKAHGWTVMSMKSDWSTVF